MRSKMSIVSLCFVLWAFMSPVYPCSLPTDSCSSTFVVGDFDNNGIIDVVFIAGGRGYPSASVVYLALVLVETRITLGEGIYLATGDFNGDGNLDLMITLRDRVHHRILLGNGDGTFEEAPLPLERA